MTLSNKPPLYLGDAVYAEIRDGMIGDNRATMKCQLPQGHTGPHKESFQRRDTPVLVQWECDERQRP